MSALDQVCQELLESVDAAVACGVLDLNSGHLIAMSRVAAMPADVDDVFASAVADIFFNSSVIKADEAVRKLGRNRDVDVSAAQELLITTAHSYQFAKRIGEARAVVLLVTSHESNVGLAWAQLRAALPQLRTALESTEKSAVEEEVDPVRGLLLQLQATATSSDGTVVIGKSEQPAGLVLLHGGLISWATARTSTMRLSEHLRRNAMRPMSQVQLKELGEASRREGRSLGQSLLAAGFIDEAGLRRSYLSHCAQALVSLSRDMSAKPLTWRSGALIQHQSPFRFSPDELLNEARQLA